MSEICRLMLLPPELRALIWSYAVIEPEPIIAYVEHRTVARPHDSYPEGLRTHRRMLPHPGLPPIAFVSYELLLEALPIYLRENTFLFNLEERNRDEVGLWMEQLELAINRQTCRWINVLERQSSDFGGLEALREVACKQRMQLWNLLHLRLEFAMRPGAPTALWRPAWVNFHHVKDPRKLVARFGGHLEQECCCWVQEGIVDILNVDAYGDYPEAYPDHLLLPCFAKALERLIRCPWQDIARHTAPSTHCAKCGKEEYPTVERDEVLHAERRELDEALQLGLMYTGRERL